MGKTYRSRTKFDTDLNVINMKNGLYDILKGEFKEHNSEYLSINQIPIVYNPTAKPKLFGTIFSQAEGYCCCSVSLTCSRSSSHGN